ncbi:hypothetical protein IE53DRAFT_387476 [Violaceomyces palustris]|uniref:Uncharacterized protein n=1 Tax=Violaceomyces palustris TaxID=1673888 RepID=A0ACD0NWS2_9BASI|nr:hypothetical protein IE53DRAFT_387476 [Violaceomyces palustris]
MGTLESVFIPLDLAQEGGWDGGMPPWWGESPLSLPPPKTSQGEGSGGGRRKDDHDQEQAPSKKKERKERVEEMDSTRIRSPPPPPPPACRARANVEGKREKGGSRSWSPSSPSSSPPSSLDTIPLWNPRHPIDRLEEEDKTGHATVTGVSRPFPFFPHV